MEAIKNYHTEKENTYKDFLQKEFKLEKNTNQELLRGFRFNEFNYEIKVNTKEG
jgi:hypothetical protein